MKKKLLILLSVIFTTMSIVGCGEVSGDLTDNDEPETEVSIDNKNSDDLTGFTYLYDYGNGFRLYADNFTKIVYVVYYGSEGNGAKATRSMGMTPWISADGNYYYVDTEERTIKELISNDTTIKDDDSKDNSSDDISDDNTQQSATTEDGDSSTLDPSVTDKINQHTNQ